MLAAFGVMVQHEGNNLAAIKKAIKKLSRLA